MYCTDQVICRASVRIHQQCIQISQQSAKATVAVESPVLNFQHVMDTQKLQPT